jgi:hypothetical protein
MGVPGCGNTDHLRTTYVLTTEFLPPGRPLLAALMRSLPTGLVLIIGSPIPQRRWMARFFVLSVLYASALFPLLFIAAYRLPGGVVAVMPSWFWFWWCWANPERSSDADDARH